MVETQVETTAPATEQPVVETGTTQSEESFFDPKSVPEELIPAYKQMQSAFTKKTQEIAEAKKEAEAIRAKAEAYGKYEQYIPALEEMLAGKEKQTTSPELQALEQQLRDAGYSDEAIEMMKLSSDFLLKQFNSQQAEKEQRAWIDNKITEASNVDKRLTDPNMVYQTEDGEKVTFGQLVEQLVASDPNWVKDPVEATKKAIRRVDALIGRAKTEGKEELSATAKAKATKFPKETSSPQGTSSTDRNLTVFEAYEEAKKELGI